MNCSDGPTTRVDADDLFTTGERCEGIQAPIIHDVNSDCLEYARAAVSQLGDGLLNVVGQRPD
jgi:hypothetical protein